MNNKDLAITLAKCESEDEVITVLKNEGYWGNKDHWKIFGKNENNYSTIGNQASAPDAALVEKLVNSVDAVLQKECLIRGIDPESCDAPQNITEALQKFYGIKDGKLSNLDTKTRNSMSYDIILAATGTKHKPNYSIIDKGEGQTPKKMPDTILSIGESNKLRIPFVQGKFNMGGTGVLRFCGKNNLQLIITKKCPLIECKNDETKELWGVTIVRRENPSEGRRSSMYTYLVDEHAEIISFQASSLSIVPSPDNNFTELDYGMFIKLFDYSMTGLKTNIVFDLNYRLALLMPSLAHPIRLIECREYKGHTLETTLSGLNVRLTDDKRENVEPDYPIPLTFNVEGDTFNASIYVFKESDEDNKKKDQNYRRDEGIIFALNGQTHGSLNKAFFRRSSVNLSYLADSLLIIVDCSLIKGRTREDLFMNSRDRLSDNDLKRKIERELEDYLKHHEGLRALQEKRRKNAISKHLNDEKPLADVLNSILKKSPTLSKLFLSGQRLQNPFSLAPSKVSEKYVGKKHPTFFTLKNKREDIEYTKYAPINHRTRLQFETDVVNDYFCRDVDQGKFQLYCMEKECNDYGINLFNGTATLTIKLPDNVKVKDIIKYKAVVSDDCIVDDFVEEFTVVVINESESTGGNGGNRKAPSGNTSNGDGSQPDGLALPQTIDLYYDNWEQYGITKENALIIKGTGETNVYDFYINMDNIHLKTEIKNIRDVSQIKLIKARYKYSMVLLGLSIINYNKTCSLQNEDYDFEEDVKRITTMISPMILPIIESMGELNIEGLLDIDQNLTA